MSEEMKTLESAEDEVTVTLKFDKNLCPTKDLFLMSLDALGDQYGFKIV
ncbi:hypothetical protein OQZ33_04255 [Pedobacter sp. MC2016-05]|nr:hypothetical protein [Pedobacter sp. MC2016-05]MCX2473538.1 hypothetical protein [Pedobacter sp. MC2016-05]